MAFLPGIEGASLMRAFAGEHDAALVEKRIDEIRRLLDEHEQWGSSADDRRLTLEEGSHAWSTTYDARKQLARRTSSE